jgi:hypothetical protein
LLGLKHKPTHGNCEGVGGFHIIDGKYGNIKLDGLDMAWTASFPGPVHEGHGKAAYYIDKRSIGIVVVRYNFHRKHN